MDDSEDIVKPRRSTRTTGTSGVAKDDGDAIAASDAHAPTKKKKKIVKRKVVKRKLIKSTSGTDDGGSDSSIASPRKKVVKKKIVKRKVTKSISTDSNNASSGDGDDNDDEVEEEASVGNISTKASPKKKRVAPKRAKSPAKKVKKAKVEPQRITEKDDLTKLWDSAEALQRHGSYSKSTHSIDCMRIEKSCYSSMNIFSDCCCHVFLSIQNSILECGRHSGPSA